MSEPRKPLYRVTVDTTGRGVRLLDITGGRRTVIDAALRVMLDHAPAWNDTTAMHPMFNVDARRFDP